MAKDDTEDQEQTEDQTIIEGEATVIPDDDDLALQEVEKELETGSEGEGEAQAEGEGAAEPEPEPAPAGEAEGEAQAEGEGAAQPEGLTIPKPRFDQVAGERDHFRDQAAYWQGQAEAFKAFGPGQQGQTTEAQPEQTPEQKITSFRQEQQAVAKRFDDGELSAAEMETERQRLDDEIWNVRQGTLSPPATEQAQQPAPSNNDLYLDEKLSDLETKHPFSRHIEGKENWDFLAKTAVSRLADQGIEYDASDPVHELRARTVMAELTDQYGPVMTGKRLDQISGGQQQQPERQEPQQKQPSPEAKARGQKLDLQQELPPDIGAAGNGDQNSDVWSEERVSSLTEEEWEALPAATQTALNRKFGDGASP